MTTDRSYWQRLGAGRASRRRALTGVGGAAGAAAFLIACGGDDTKESGSSGTSTSGGQAASGTQAAEEQPRAGGIISQPMPTDPPNLDIHQVTTYSGVWPTNGAFNQLIQIDPNKAGDTAQDIVADLATK